MKAGQGRKVAAEPEVVNAFYRWVQHGGPGNIEANEEGFKDYVHGIAEARYVIRRVFRIVDEQARKAGLEPLEHQALIQVFGARGPLRVIDVADRLDIAPAFASRLVKTLTEKGLVTRSRAQAESDRRITVVAPTDEARDLLAAIDESVELHVGHFQRQLSDSQRAAALGIFAFYLGASPASEDMARLVDIVRRTERTERTEPMSPAPMS